MHWKQHEDLLTASCSRQPAVASLILLIDISIDDWERCTIELLYRHTGSLVQEAIASRSSY